MDNKKSKVNRRQFEEKIARLEPKNLKKVKSLAVFGSLARGEETASSDVDMLLETKLALSFFELQDLEDNLQQVIGKPVDLHTKQSISPYILPFIDTDLVIVYENN